MSSISVQLPTRVSVGTFYFKTGGVGRGRRTLRSRVFSHVESFRSDSRGSRLRYYLGRPSVSLGHFGGRRTHCCLPSGRSAVDGPRRPSTGLGPLEDPFRLTPTQVWDLPTTQPLRSDCGSKDRPSCVTFLGSWTLPLLPPPRRPHPGPVTGVLYSSVPTFTSTEENPSCPGPRKDGTEVKTGRPGVGPSGSGMGVVTVKGTKPSSWNRRRQ